MLFCFAYTKILKKKKKKDAENYGQHANEGGEDGYSPSLLVIH